VSVLYRPCVKDATIGELKLYDVTDFSRPPVWSVRLADPDQGKLEIPIATDVPGYTVDDRLHGPLEPNRDYRVDGQSDKGVSWEGPTFKPEELRPGQVRESGHYDDVASWVHRGSRCGPGVGAALVGGGLAVAVTAVLVIAVLMVVRRRRVRAV
jgi:hypothetical protein